MVMPDLWMDEGDFVDQVRRFPSDPDPEGCWGGRPDKKSAPRGSLVPPGESRIGLGINKRIAEQTRTRTPGKNGCGPRDPHGDHGSPVAENTTRSRELFNVMLEICHPLHAAGGEIHISSHRITTVGESPTDRRQRGSHGAPNPSTEKNF